MLEVHVPGGGEVGPGGDGRVEGGAGGRAGVITPVRGRFELDWGSAAAAEDGGSDPEIGKLPPPASALSEVIALGVDELGGGVQAPGGRDEGAEGAVDEAFSCLTPPNGLPKLAWIRAWHFWRPFSLSSIWLPQLPAACSYRPVRGLAIIGPT